jgi:hypothetical protein
MRSISPGYFAALGVPLLAGRDFNADDRNGSEPVVIVSQTLARRLFGDREALNRGLRWTDPVMRFIGISPEPRRIVGVVADLDDEHVVAGEVMTVYHPFEQQVAGGRLFVHTRQDPYALAPQVVRIVRDLSADQPVERAATLADIRAEVLTPDRLNVAGVLAFSVSGRTREFGIRIALGSMPQHILRSVVKNGAMMAAVGIVLGVGGGFAAARLASHYLEQVQMPGAIAVGAAAALLLVAGVAASIVPAARAARTNVIDALRAD